MTAGHGRHAEGQAERTMTRASNTVFRVGKDSRGRWVARNDNGRAGGLFVNREAAIKFALFENGHRPEAIVTVPGVFELDLGVPALAA
jgi:hypothetical protein